MCLVHLNPIQQSSSILIFIVCCIRIPYNNAMLTDGCKKELNYEKQNIMDGYRWERITGMERTRIQQQ